MIIVLQPNKPPQSLAAGALPCGLSKWLTSLHRSVTRVYIYSAWKLRSSRTADNLKWIRPVVLQTTMKNWPPQRNMYKIKSTVGSYRQELIIEMRNPNVTWRIIWHVYLFTAELRHTCSDSDTCTPKYLWSNAYISNGRRFTKSAFVSCYYPLSVFLQ